MGEKQTIEEQLAEELTSGVLDNTETDYQAKLPSVNVGRGLGFTDKELELSLGIILKPEDRTGT